MLTFFVDPYEEEMITSLFARYHFYSGNVDKSDTLEELLGERGISAFRTVPSRLNYLESRIENSNYTSDYFIYKHTIFPLYSMFLSRDKQNEVIECMKERGSEKACSILSISRGKVDVRKRYKYCPLCVEDDVEIYGEAYFHRLHQIEGILVCEKHGCKLYDYIEINNSNMEFVRLEYKNIFTKEPTFYKKSINDSLIIIAKIAKYILKIEYLKYSKEDIIEIIKKFLYIKGYLKESRVVRQKKLIAAFNRYYDKKLLKLLNSEIDTEKNCWIRLIFQKRTEMVHPIRYILLIWFLVNNDVGEFFREIEEKAPFGKKPWPCLNPICKQYKKKVIKNIKIVKVRRSKLLNGIFECKVCNYMYMRKGPDKSNSDIYKKDKVLEYGLIWKNEFVKRIQRNDKKKDIQKDMGINWQFINRYIKNNGFKPKYKPNIGNRCDNFEKYTSDIKEYMQKKPNNNRTMISKEMSKQVGWLKYNNPEWLKENLPKPMNTYIYTGKSDYKKIDIEICKNVKDIYKELIKLEKPKRITLTLMEKLLKVDIRRRIDKLPKTKVYLDVILESVNEFRIRRVQVYCDKLIKEKKYKSKTKILQGTGILFQTLSSESAEEINSIIEKYHHDIISKE